MVDCQNASAAELEEKLKSRIGDKVDFRVFSAKEMATIINHRLENKKESWVYFMAKNSRSGDTLLPLKNSKGKRVLMQLQFKNVKTLVSLYDEVEKSRAIPFDGRQLLVVVVSSKESVPQYLLEKVFNKVVNIPQNKTFYQVFPEAKSAEGDNQSVEPQQARPTIDLMVTDLDFLGLKQLKSEITANFGP